MPSSKCSLSPLFLLALLCCLGNGVVSVATFSHSCAIGPAHHVNVKTDILDLNLSFPLLVIPPVKEVTYYDYNSASSLLMPSLISLANEVTITTTQHEDDKQTQQSIIITFDNFCSFQNTREILPSSGASSSIVTNIHSIVVQFTSPLDFEHSSEEYSVNISISAVTVSTPSLKGLQNALATLDQLFHSPVPLHTPVVIFDYPDYPYRGLMIDVARHFIPPPLLHRTIDAMAASKLSVLHLHLTDATSFPVLLDDTVAYPLSSLAAQGSHPANVGDPKVYSKDTLATLVRYAADRGIEVIPEIDLPSHTWSWGKSFPDILVNCSSYANFQENSQNIYTLDPTHPSTLPIVYEVLSQITEIFPSSFMHIGGDEVHTACWADLHIPDTGVDDLLHDFMMDIFTIVRSLGKIPIAWQDTVDEGVFPYEPENEDIFSLGSEDEQVNVFVTNTEFVVPKKSESRVSPTIQSPSALVSHVSSSSWAIVETWKCWDGLAGKAAGKALDSGLDVITSACWYLDFDSDLEVIYHTLHAYYTEC
jgi:hypothetical protein